MTEAAALDRGRESFSRRAWREAYEQLAAADRASPLAPEDLERLATAAHLVGRSAEWGDVLARAHQEWLARGEPERAAMAAYQLGFELLRQGEPARGSGWLARARRVLDDVGRDSVVEGYLLVPAGVRAMMEGHPEPALETFARAVMIGERYGDAELITLARHGQGRALIRLGHVADGLALLDEVMVAVTTGEVSPLAVGGIYCSILDACHEIFDLSRAREWTEALHDWCAAQPDLVPYRGHCLIRRAEVMQINGAWAEAMSEAERACECLSRPTVHQAIGAAHYQRGEVHRLRGQTREAEAAYRESSQSGRQPQPGLALLRLQQGQLDVAAAAIRRVVAEARDVRARSRVLGAFVEIMLAAGDVDAARAGADELAVIATRLEAPYLQAVAAHCAGAVLLAAGEPAEAIAELRRACDTWSSLEAPYEAARTSVLLARAGRALGDSDTATIQLDAARRTFEALGAAPELRQLEELARETPASRAGGLTARELEVLRLVATGKTNRAIAQRLGISEKTVARHVANIFGKLGLSSRAAATAYAYQHELLPRPASA